MFICAICGRFFRTQYPCSYMLSVGDSFCCLRFILPQIPQISQILYIPVSVLICAICGKLLRPRYPCSSAISVGAILCILRLFSHRFHRYSQILYIPISVLICAICGTHLRTQYPCSSVLSVGDFLCCLRFILPLIPQIFTDFIYPISVFICAICGRFLRTTMEALIPSSTAICGLCADPLPSLSPPRAGVASPRRSGPSRSGRRVARYAPVRRDEHLRPRSSRTPLCW